MQRTTRTSSIMTVTRTRTMTMTMTMTWLAALCIAAVAHAGDDLDVPWSTVAGGGGTTSGGDYTLATSIGQHEAGGPLTGGDFTLIGGFHAGPAGPGCFGDITGDGDVNVLDLIQVLLEWGNASSPADLNGDGTVDVADMVVVITSWGSCV